MLVVPADVTYEFPSAESIASALSREQDQALAARGWSQLPKEAAGKEYTFYYRDLLDVGVGSLLTANRVDLEGGPQRLSEGGWVRYSMTLNADLFLEENGLVRRTHGSDARVLMATSHADEALVSWSGAHHMCPIRAEFASLHGDGHLVTIRYVPHISKALEHTQREILAASDARTDLFQRCLAVVLRRFIRASEVGYPLDIPGVGQ